MMKIAADRIAAEMVAAFSSGVRGAPGVGVTHGPSGASFELPDAGGNMLAQISAPIPHVPPSPAPIPGGDYPHLRKKSATRVLVVDDEALVRWSIAETLGANGCDIVEASDAQGAYAAILDRAHRPDAVLLDLKLPDSAD